ncbi:universal stress protein PHOS32-like [Apium graveolens]|uniref:universal stress protein PHOS32-like n=1 Tax=Apium graveolens TaxID=4045 RepID=UPI003D7BF23C
MEAGKMMNEKRILVAVDESEESMHALSWCLTNLFPQSNKTILFLLYVKPPPPVYSSIDAAGFLFSGDVVEVIEKYGKDLATSVMNRAETVCNNFNSNIKVEKKVGSGDAKEVICAAVKKLQVDMLVIGSHDYGFLKRTILGSVSDYCSKHVKCPTVVVKLPKNGKNLEHES